LTFKKGQSGNPKGRRPKEREVEYTNIIQSSCSPSDWKTIVNKAVEQAKRGDEKARKWLSDNLIGLPVQKNEITGKDGSSIKVRLTGTDD
jgi:hypothetical protein